MRAEGQEAKARLRDPLAKGLSLLRWMMLHSEGNWRVRDIASAINLAPSSTHRLLTALVAEDYLEQDSASGCYSLSLDFFRISRIAAGRTPLQEMAMPHMRRLVEACNESVFLSLYDAGRMQIITVAGVESSSPLRYVIEMNTWKPVHVGAGGLAIMAFLSDAERCAIIERTGLSPVTERSITDPRRLEQELSIVRQRGWARARGQRIRGAVGIAAPVFGPNQKVLGDVGLTIPEQRFSEDDEPRLVALLLHCTNAITKEAGGTPFP